MAQKIMVYDTTLGTEAISATDLSSIGGGGSSYLETSISASDGQTVFTSSHDITADNKVQVLIGGLDLEEGSSSDWTRNATNNTITTNYSIPLGTKVRIRVYT